jgi:hypothetical protein
MSDDLITTIQGKLRIIEGEPRWLDFDVAEWIGLSDRDEFRRRARKSESTLSKLGVIVSFPITPGTAGGRPSEEYWLNEKQCYYLIARSQQTPRAEEVTIAIIEAAYAFRHGRIGPRGPMPIDQAEFYKTLVDKLSQIHGDTSETKKELKETKDKVEAIESDVIEIKRFIQSGREDFGSKVTLAIKRANFEIDRGRCSYCAFVQVVEQLPGGQYVLTKSGCLDHVHTRNRKDFENAICACKGCNQRREYDASYRKETLILAEAFHLKAARFNPDRKIQKDLPFNALGSLRGVGA